MTKNHAAKEIAETVLRAIFSKADVKKLSKLRGVILCGFPGCGKSTIAQLLHDAYGFEVLSTDQIRVNELFTDQKHRHASEHDQVMTARYMVYEELARRVNKKLNDHGKVVVDGTNLDAKRFTIIGSMSSKLPSSKMAMVVVKTPEWIIKNRFINWSKERYGEWWSVYKYWKDYVKAGKANFPQKKELSNVEIIKPKRYAVRTFDWVPEIKAVMWDVDKTLYDEKKAKLGVEFDRLNIAAIMAKTNQSLQVVKKEFNKRYLKLHSKTKVIDSFGLNGKEEIEKVAPEIDYQKYLKRDVKLQKLFSKLKHLDHYIYTNQTAKPTMIKLKALGFKSKVFSKIFANYDLGFRSKTEESFKAVLKELPYKPQEILVIGDRPDQDILPAQKMGMRTCMVWGRSQLADVSLKSVYEVAGLFGVEL